MTARAALASTFNMTIAQTGKTTETLIFTAPRSGMLQSISIYNVATAADASAALQIQRASDEYGASDMLGPGATVTVGNATYLGRALSATTAGGNLPSAFQFAVTISATETVADAIFNAGDTLTFSITGGTGMWGIFVLDCSSEAPLTLPVTIT